MKQLKKFVIFTFLFTVTGSAHATLIDFKADANSNERGYSTLNYPGLKITASSTRDNDPNQYAYMDSKYGASVANGGLGSCMDINNNNQCNPSSDDNVATGESVHMKWDSNIMITGIWFNNNHDSDYSLVGNTINIGGVNYTFGASNFDATRSSGNGTLADAIAKRNADFLYNIHTSVNRNSSFNISYFNGQSPNLIGEQFYISAIQYETVPEPGVLALLSIGLIGLVTTGRRQYKSS